MSNEIPRRRLLRTGAAVTAGLGVVGTAGASENDTVETEGQIPCVDLTDVEDRTTTISASGPVPEQATGIQPGSQMFIEYPDGTTAGCTANFIWRDTSTTIGDDFDDERGNSPVFGDDRNPLYIGAAGHCFLPGNETADDEAGDDFEKTYDVSQLTVKVCKNCTFGGITGLSFVDGEVYELGEVVYARQALPNDEGTEGDEVGHDFGPVRIPEEFRPAVDPSMPQFGGPIGTQDGVVPAGETVCQYGAGVGNGEAFATAGTRGVSEGDIIQKDVDGDGANDSWYAGIRASPGDSGSLLVEYEAGQGTDAAGVLTHLTTVGTAGTTVSRCIQLPKRDDIGLELDVVRGNEDVTT
ncbi:hypothetical protein BRD02_12985 [Halobacteriales archaeon QS_8_69_73]|nr:MAG: hypothetical protein BRD02_12985 [Halobacteriales archaeon QS_8_69_73]